MLAATILAAVTLLLVPAVMVPIVREGMHHTRRARRLAWAEASARFAAAARGLGTSLHGIARAVDLARPAFDDFVAAFHGIPVGMLHTTPDMAESWHYTPHSKFGDLVTTTTHIVPAQEGATSCCGKTWFELPRDERITVDPALANCAALADSAPTDDQLAINESDPRVILAAVGNVLALADGSELLQGERNEWADVARVMIIRTLVDGPSDNQTNEGVL